MRPPLWRAIIYGSFGALVTAGLIGIPTALIPNPLFSRMILPDTIDYVIFAATVVLVAALAATYAWPSACPLPQGRTTLGTVATYFAVGCPVCNKLVLLLLGTSGALQWFAPIQPLLGVLGLGLLAWALAVRVRAVRLRGRSVAPVDTVERPA
ncbi:hypothetical protein OO015_13085 [Thermomicrobium sp. 4228-Ro]|uniref:hypothetical protein n=1 Tax=Thermomicrobium sp. 4228-Ro TaxID=2993937 RepID=UPI002248DFB1|nr:hypothetical protein [Thermomicrobium sp. 4228-Ro]MCX2728423.1 hypothetical protein [Thermomicrobium sp. 4228-Ro]